MTALVLALRTLLPGNCNRFVCLKSVFATLFFVFPFLASHAIAQATIAISGTVYDPRTTAASLPLPNVLVYATTGPVVPFPSGVQCITSSNSTPTGVIAYTYTAVDGTFTMGNIPVNSTFTVVIQAGKWRRQFTYTSGTTPITGLTLHMPSDHTQGDIPMIAIASGSVDGLECVLLDMGIFPTEFTDDNGSINPGGHIHLYQGSSSPGATINASTPNQSSLMSNSATMNAYDVVMFPCQGNANNQSSLTDAPANLLSYANAGGRVFATHYSYAWLDPATPYNSQFPPVANWAINQQNPSPDPGLATINTGFTDASTLAQWLFNTGSSANYGQVQLSTLRHDLNSVIAPTQSWATHNATADVMQFTFNAPVGAAAANQCGRVLFNEYHVYNVSSTGAVYNSALPNGQTFSECSQQPHAMTPQEEMLEYALFDLSSFVTPVVIPTLSFSFSPSPMLVKSGDTADQVTINVTNTSATSEIYSSVVITLALPTGLTATALADSTGGWICKLATLTCTRTTSIAASASDSFTLTVSVPTYGSGPVVTSQIVATAASPNFSNNVTGSGNVIFRQTPVITWPTPANIIYLAPLGGAQLNATTTVAGTFNYAPSAGTVLSVGQHTLSTTFAPADSTDYTPATASVVLTVIPVNPTLTITSNANPVFMANAVTFTATIPSIATAPTGTVTFYDGATQIGTGSMSAGGSATFTSTTLSNVIHSITAVYSGDTSYRTARSGALSETVIDFTIAPAGTGKATAPATGVASYPILITPVGGSIMPAAMTLSVTGLSVGATAAFSPTNVTAGSGATTVTLQVQLPGNAALEAQGKPFGRGALPFMLSLILLPFAGRLRKSARRWTKLAVLVLVGAAMAVGLNGCGAPGKLNPNSYSLTVTATSGGLSHTTSLNLTVQ
jgi:hypothetical protein